MRNHFAGYFPPTETELKLLLLTCEFSFDANVLLHLYRYTKDTRDKFLEIMRKLKGRLWLPHQVVLEYMRRRLEAIWELPPLHRAFIEKCENMVKAMEEECKRSPLFKRSAIPSIVKPHLEKAIAELKKLQAEHEDFSHNDPIRTQLDDLFHDAVGAPYPETEYAKKETAAVKRHKAKVPPGYMDRNKDQEKSPRIGDVLVWFQLLDHVGQAKKPLVFVTDDKKEDWWEENGGKTIGPRPELRQEMYEAGVQFYLYSPEQFLKYAQDVLAVPVEPKAFEEAKSVAEPKLSIVIDGNEVDPGYLDFLKTSQVVPPQIVSKHASATIGDVMGMLNRSPLSLAIDAMTKQGIHFPPITQGEILQYLLNQPLSSGVPPVPPRGDIPYTPPRGDIPYSPQRGDIPVVPPRGDIEVKPPREEPPPEKPTA